MKQKARIEDWQVVLYGDHERLEGRVLDHPNQESFHADRQMTSPLVSIDKEAGVAETFNTIYTLGVPYNG